MVKISDNDLATVTGGFDYAHWPSQLMDGVWQRQGEALSRKPEAPKGKVGDVMRNVVRDLGLPRFD